MDVERLVVRLVADATMYTRVLDTAEARLVYFAAAISEAFLRQSAVMAAAYERNAVAFEVMAGSAEAAIGFLDRLNQVAVETPFHSAELVAYSKQLKAFGFEMHDLEPVLRTLGDVSAGTGGRMDRLVLAFGQVRTAGRLMGQEVRQFTNAGVPLLENLAAVMGKPTDQVRSLIHQGRVGFPEVVKAFNRMTGAGGAFENMMDRINKTTAGRWEAMTERLQITVREIGLAAFEGLKVGKALDQIGSLFEGAARPELIEFWTQIRAGAALAWHALMQVVRAVRSWTERNQELVATFVASYVALKAFTAAWIFLGVAVGVATNPFVLAAAAVTGLVVALGAIAPLRQSMEQAFAGMTDTLRGAWAGVVDAVKGGDIQLAFDIALKAMELAWRRFTLGIKIGFQNFIDEFVTAFRFGWERGLMEMTYEFRLLAAKVPLLGGAEDERFLRTNRAADLANLEKRRQAELAALPGRFGGRLAGLGSDPTSARLTRELGEMIGEGQLARIMGENNAALRSLSAQFVQLRADGFVGVSPIPPGLAPDLGRDTGGFLGTMTDRAIQKIHNDLYYTALNRAVDLRAAVTRGADPGVIERLGKTTADALAAVEKATATARGLHDLLPPPLQVSARAIDMVADLTKKLEEGISPMERFTRQVDALNEAARGPLPGLGAVAGGLALGNPNRVGSILGPFGGAIIDEEKKRTGLFLAYQDLQKSIGNRMDRLPPAMLQGSQAAQDTINRAQSNQLTVQQEILRTILEGKYIQEQQAEYQRRAAEALEALTGDGSWGGGGDF